MRVGDTSERAPQAFFLHIMTNMTDEYREKLGEMLAAEVNGELAYDAMYDAIRPTTATARYSDLKDYMGRAVYLAKELGLEEDAKRLDARLEHMKAVFRSQFV